jgi:hypothetical protein
MGVFKCADRMNGDDSLSPFERKLWALTYSCLYKFGCPVMFNVFGPMAQHKIDRTITFFVPTFCESSHLVIDYLRHELESEARDGQKVGEEYWPGTKVEIVEFSGTDFYLERDVVETMAQQAMKAFMDKVKERKKN